MLEKIPGSSDFIAVKTQKKKVLSSAPSIAEIKTEKKLMIIFILRRYITVAQSICTHCSSLSGRPDIFFRVWNFKKSGPKYGPNLFRVTNRPMFSKQK